MSSKIEANSSSDNGQTNVLTGLLTWDRILYDIPISSKKRLLESLQYASESEYLQGLFSLSIQQ